MRKYTKTAFLSLLLVIVGCSQGAPERSAAAPQAAALHANPISGVQHFSSKRVCEGSNTPGVAHCHAYVRTDATGNVVTSFTPQGFGPADLRAAYNIPTSGGNGKIVAIVDAQDDPNAEADLGVYRAQYGIPPCTTANGCFTKVNQLGQASPLPAGDSGWGAEISLDLDMVSSACPDCKILLVEADSPSFDDLGTAVNTAATLGGVVISNSYGGGEQSTDPQMDTMYFQHPGVDIFASSGDGGFGVEYPAASFYVTAVGGTSLVKDTSQRGWTETAWSGAGSGCSQYTAKPTWQKDTGCANKTVADESAIADPDTGVAVYDTYGQPGWAVYGGTSVASPLTAAIYAITGNNAATPQYSYTNTSFFYDVTSGNNGSCSPAYLCTAGAGYDGPTGNGTPDALLMAGPSGTVSGTVTSSAGGPVAGATVALAGPSAASTTTSATGTYSLQVPVGTYTETVSATFYQTATVANVAVTQNVTTTENVILTALPTGFIQGTVTDANTKLPLTGAQVQALQGQTVSATATTDAKGDYSFQLLVGSYTVNASNPGYTTGTATVNLAANQTVTQNFALTSPEAAVTPTSLTFIQLPNEQRTQTLTLSNAGSAPLTWQIKTSGGGMVGNAESIPANSKLIRNPAADPSARTTSDLFLNGKTAGWTPINPNVAGTILTQFASNAQIPFGVGFITDEWISDAVGIVNQEYSLTGTAEQQFTTPWAGNWPGDMAYDSTHNLMCQVNVGGDNGIYCWDPTTGAVSKSITGTFAWTSTSQRGLAYRADNDSFYVGGWNQGIVYQVSGLNSATPGTVLNQCTPSDPNISGLSYNGTANVIWEATNSSTDTIYQLNADTCATLSTIAPPDPGNHGGGIEIDASGNLWIITQSPQTVYLLESDVPTYNNVPWLTIKPTSGTAAAGSSTAISVEADTTKLAVGVYSAVIYVLSDAPGAPKIQVPVSLVVTSYRQGVNAGGPAYVDSLGDTWSADQAYTAKDAWGYLENHGTHDTKAKIAGTPDPTLFQTQRVAPYAYQFTGLTDGVYQVELGFAELEKQNKVGSRLFNVIINDTLVLPDFDITYDAGNLTADWHSFTTTVTNGAVDIRFIQQSLLEQPVINAVRVTLRPDLK